MNAQIAIINCRIVNSLSVFEGAIYIRDGKIAAITKTHELEAKEVIDAKGRFVLPGAIDGHIHMMDPGFTTREDFQTGTRAAARGGVTTIIELPNQARPEVFTADLLRERRDYLAPKAMVNFALMGGLRADHKKDLRPMWEAGALGFKGFMSQRADEEVLNSGRLTELLDEIKHFDGVALIHAEDDSILKYNEKRLKATGRKDYRALGEWRSREAEISAVKQAVDAAEAVGARMAIAHVSLPELIDYIRRARDRGARVYSETCPQYFTLTVDDVVKNGPYNKFTPPARGESETEGIWERLKKGQIDMVNSDHVPHEREVKDKGLASVWDAPFGIPGVETTTRLLLDGVSRGKLSINRVALMRSENAAQIYGLADRKGYIQPGYDADLVIVNLEKSETLSDQAILSKCGWTPFRGRTICGDIVLTMVGGNVIMKDGEVIGVPGSGRFVTRS